MATTTGFLEYTRELPTDRDPLERIKDWDEFQQQFSEEQLKQQGARCMDCGVPYCHTGSTLNQTTAGCPIHNLIPEWNHLVYLGKWREALDRLHKTNNFPEFTGRVCPAPCEGSCTVGLNGDPVTIKNIEQAIVDRGFEEGWIVAQPPKQRTGKRIAIVGSGPAGLSCAQQLNTAGHLVTVYEKADRIGGLLTYGIPAMKLDKSVVERRVQILQEEGITFVTSTEVGVDITEEQLKEDYDAIVLCGGAQKGRKLNVEGEDANGVHLAMEYLTLSQKSYLDSNFADGNFISAENKDVIVIGGGDTGTDCIATALRQKCKSVTQFVIYPETAVERLASNPWPEYPNVYRLDYGQKEAKALYGQDPRAYKILTEKIVKDDQGNVKELHTVEVIRTKHKDGTRHNEIIPGTQKVWPAQLVFVAMGFSGPEGDLIDNLGVERDRWSCAKAEYGKYKTNVEGVFAAGDVRRGQSLVVWAINEGREAAREVDKYLMGTSELP
ncbi:glutamate synthase subunit beta [Longirhabdus pacifica]|uniref:glutamate synthase subunit beta n=1 Tax=Longirhabdus pacifica TaxID=2305227 RepID=UPI0010092749|nr:glutamate synthase subunit beta [Longirhabdus pacifica]